MADFSQFNEEVETDYSEFSDPTPGTTVETIPSDLSVAAQGVLISSKPEEALTDFFNISAELQKGNRQPLDTSLEGAKEELTAQTRDLVQKLILDPSVSQAEAEKLVVGVGELQEGKLNSQDMLASQMIAADSGVENAEEEESRVEEATTVGLLNEFKNSKQAIMNSALLGSEDSSLDAVGDFFEYLVPFSEGVFTADLVSNIRGGDKVAASKAIFALGQTKRGLRDLFTEMDAQQQLRFQSVLAGLVNSSSGIVFTNDNNLMQKDLFATVTEGNYYGTTEQVLDNVTSVLDLLGVGWSVKALSKTSKVGKLRKFYNLKGAMVDEVKSKLMRSKVQPASTGSLLKETNPQKATDVYSAVATAEGDELPLTLFGARREEVIADSHLPQMPQESGAVDNRVHDLDKDVLASANRDGVIYANEDELLAIENMRRDELNNVIGMHNRREMNTKVSGVSAKVASEPSKTAAGTVFKEIYGPAKGGWRSPQNSIDRTLFNLRGFGVEESDLVLLQKVGDEYVPTTVADAMARRSTIKAFNDAGEKVPDELAMSKENYLVQTNFEHKFDPSDITSSDAMSVKRNWFDYIPAFNRAKPGSSSVTRFLFDPASLFDYRVFGGANEAVDRGAALEVSLIEATKGFTEPYKKLDTVRQEFIQRTLQRANAQKKQPDMAYLLANGATLGEIDILNEWRKAWDNVWYLENKDLKMTLNTDGYKLFVDTTNDTSLVVRPITRQAADRVGLVYDSTTGEVRRLAQGEADALYEGGGNISKLRKTEDVDGTDVDFVISREQQAGEYTRAFNESDALLNHIDGYYTVRYKDPHFIDKQILDSNGNIIRREAVKTAPTIKAADTLSEGLNAANTNEKIRYVSRPNKDLVRETANDDYWSLQSHNGRTAQRIRGDRVGTTSGVSADEAMGHIEGPVESLLNSVRSISRRTSMRSYLDTYKTRFMDEYGDMLEADKVGNKVMPRQASDLNPVEGLTNKRAADARTHLEYINYLENGYRNSLDDVYKATMNSLADLVGGVSETGEKVIRAGLEEVVSPSGRIKMVAFDAYLATNPLRQFVVQAHQGTLLAANFGDYVLSQRLAKDLTSVYMTVVTDNSPKVLKSLAKFSGRSEAELKKMAKDYINSGLDASIDRQNLVEGGLDQMVETTRGKGAKEFYRKTVGTTRKIGFDQGERINIMSAWLAHRDDALKTTKSLSQRDLSNIAAKARNYTFNMNYAGDMPYNKNSLSVLFQFMQVPHKAMLQVASNRGLSGVERSKLLAYNMAMLPLPAGFALSYFGQVLPEDQATKELMLEGVESAVFNKLASLISEGETSVDFRGLAAIDPEAPYELIHGILTGNLMEIASSSPSLQMFVGHNPRVANFVREAKNVVMAPDVSTDEMMALAQSFGNISSGVANFSQAYKELFVNELANRYNKAGQPIAKNLTTPEMVAKAFGLPTQREGIDRRVKQKLYEDSQAATDDVRKFYKLQTNHLANMGLNRDSDDWESKLATLRSMSTGWVQFNERQKQEYFKLVLKDARKGEEGVLGYILRSSGYVPTETTRRAVNSLEDKTGVEEFNEVLDFIEGQQKLGEE